MNYLSNICSNTPQQGGLRCITSIVVLMCLLLTTSYTLQSQTTAGMPGIVAGFEIDENFSWDAVEIDGVTGTTDWRKALGDLGDDCVPPVHYQDPDPDIGEATWMLDDRWNGNFQDASAFGGTSNKNSDLIGPGQSPWTTTTGSGPQKDDLTNVFFHTRVDANGHRWMIFAAETRASNGDSHVGWEYNQAGVTWDPNTNTITGNGPLGGRSLGDILVVCNYEHGGVMESIELFMWGNTLDPNGSWEPETLVAGTFYLVVNQTDIPALCDSSSFTPGGDTTDISIDHQFCEGAIDITYYNLVPQDLCLPEATVNVKSRSSQSFNSELKDFILFHFPLEPNPVCSTEVTDVTCHGLTDGEIVVTGSVGNPPYEFSLNGGPFQSSGTFSGLAADTYTITISDDNGCTSTCEATIQEPDELTCGAEEDAQVVCYGDSNGEATVTPEGGNGGYEYLWDNAETTASATALTAGWHVVTVTDSKGCTSSCEVYIDGPDELTCGAEEDAPVRCYGESNGEATVTPSGGNGGYEYLWDDTETTATATGLDAGWHTVTVTDSESCTTSCEVFINEPVELTCDAEEDVPVRCYGETNGEATVSPSGGNGGYEYLWDSGETTATATGLDAGWHTVTVTDSKGCETSCDVFIHEPDELTCNAEEDAPVRCYGESNGEATVTPSGGNGGNEYAWDNGETTATATGLDAGWHTVTVTDSKGCETSCDVFINEPDELTCEAEEDAPVVCYGESNGEATVTPSGGNGGNTYEWDSGETTATATGLDAGWHTVTVTDSKGCETSCDVFINEPDELTCEAEEDAPVVCYGESNGEATVTPSGGNGGNTYEWDSGETTATATGLDAGWHTVTVTDSKGCETSCDVFINEPDELTCEAEEDAPVVCNGESNGEATVTPSGGNGGNTYEWDSGETTATATGLGAGWHTVTVTDVNGCMTSCDVFINEPDELTCGADEDVQVRCYGESNGEATVTPSGGNGGNTYAWDNGETTATATGLDAGWHTVTVTDSKGCMTSCDVFINEPDELTCDIAPFEGLPECGGATTNQLTASVYGGTPVYAYNWSVVLVDGDGNELALDPADYGWSIASGDGTNSINFVAGDVYRAKFVLLVRDDNGCETSCDAFVDPCCLVELLKMTCNSINPNVSWDFALYMGPDGYDGTMLGSDNTSGDMDGMLDFGFPALSGANTYTICETGIPAAMFYEWMIDTDNNGVADAAIIPYNPDADLPTPEDNGTRCFDFGYGTGYDVIYGGTLMLQVDNCPPGGSARTPGYWKNWSTCSNGNQAQTAENNGGVVAGWWLIDDVLPITWCDFTIDNCEDAVNILDHRQVCGNNKKMANDGAYKLARNLLAAQANFTAGAETCPEVLQAAADAEALLCELEFDGCGNYLRPKDGPLYNYAVCLATCLDNYNNNILCGYTTCSCSETMTQHGYGHPIAVDNDHFVMEDQELDVHVFPVPATSDVTIEFRTTKDEKLILEVYDIMGKSVARIFDAQSGENNTNTARLDATTLHGGAYIYVFRSDRWMHQGKLIIANE